MIQIVPAALTSAPLRVSLNVVMASRTARSSATMGELWTGLVCLCLCAVCCVLPPACEFHCVVVHFFFGLPSAAELVAHSTVIIVWLHIVKLMVCVLGICSHLCLTQQFDAW